MAGMVRPVPQLRPRIPAIITIMDDQNKTSRVANALERSSGPTGAGWPVVEKTTAFVPAITNSARAPTTPEDASRVITTRRRETGRDRTYWGALGSPTVVQKEMTLRPSPARMNESSRIAYHVNS